MIMKTESRVIWKNFQNIFKMRGRQLGKASFYGFTHFPLQLACDVDKTLKIQEPS